MIIYQCTRATCTCALTSQAGRIYLPNLSQSDKRPGKDSTANGIEYRHSILRVLQQRYRYSQTILVSKLVEGLADLWLNPSRFEDKNMSIKKLNNNELIHTEVHLANEIEKAE